MTDLVEGRRADCLPIDEKHEGTDTSPEGGVIRTEGKADAAMALSGPENAMAASAKRMSASIIFCGITTRCK
jgi:hypothetical protein